MQRYFRALAVVCLLFAPLSRIVAQAAQEFGIDRSNLTREKESVEEKALHDIRSLHAAWFRDVLSGGTSPEGIAKFVNELKLAKQNDLKFLANILPACADYDGNCQNQNAGEDFRKRCGWSQGSGQFSRVNLAKLARRLRTEFDAVKAANLTIDAFEIGNEVDWICFNGDVPDGREPTQADWMTAVRGYAHFLRTTAEIIHDPHYFPQAKIITFGIAHGSDRWDRPPHHFSSPARMVAMLRNLDGFNYLDNASYHVDGYGTHIYPNPDNLEQSVTDLIGGDAEILGPDKPFWITEWGLAAAKYPNKQGQSRAQAFRDFYATLDKLHIPFGPAFYYAYSPGGSSLIDADGALLPEASALAVGDGVELSAEPPATHAEGAVVGVGFVFAPYDLPPEEQETVLGQMQHAGVKVVRCSMSYDDKGVAFAQRVYAHGIRIVWLVGLTPAAGTQWPHAPEGFKGLWQGYPLSSIDPQRFRENFGSMLARLEEKGIVLEAFEPGNEINWAGFNADFSLPGEGRVLGKDDLTHDPEGKRVAQGYLQYLKLLDALKDLRDHSKLNQHTPIITAGLADVGGSTWPHQRRADAVDISATFDFLRAHGLDQLVDGYGIHSYPPSSDPGTSAGAAKRRQHVEENGLEECQPSGSTKGKPCWITEWGVGGANKTCPAQDGDKVKLVREMREYYGEFMRQGRIEALIFYVWHGAWHAPQENPASAFRCGALTESGRLAIAPL
jgi:hypothetical protein